ncbi:MAG: hypothetical protein IPP13_03330 [Kouleothrix sp.]|jgi:hypothetical protein|nr:hypothetical protein [Kouleothrix sp.]
MPWEIILAALGGSSLTAIIITVVGLTFAQKFIEQGISSAGRRFESSLLQAEEAYKKVVDVSAQIDTHLREQRIKVYGTIWLATSILPRWPRATGVTYPDILRFSETLRSWYFEQGGMWLSTDARQVYGQLQEQIWQILPKHSDGTITDEEYDAVLAQCSALRTELTKDLVSRRAAPTNP